MCHLTWREHTAVFRDARPLERFGSATGSGQRTCPA
ncbi:hypothetical protein [Streptomyces albidoflavus]